MQRWKTLVGIAAAGLAGSPSAPAEESEEPDLEFLEYLGSWQAQDDEWVIAAEWESDEAGEADAKPEPEAERKRNE